MRYLFILPKKYKNTECLVTSENVFSNERSDYWTGACTCHSSPQITRSNLTCFQCYRWRACLFCKHRERSTFKLEIWHRAVRRDAIGKSIRLFTCQSWNGGRATVTVAHHFPSNTVIHSPRVIQLMQLNTQLWYSRGVFDRARSLILRHNVTIWEPALERREDRSTHTKCVIIYRLSNKQKIHTPLKRSSA